VYNFEYVHHDNAHRQGTVIPRLQLHTLQQHTATTHCSNTLQQHSGTTLCNSTASHGFQYLLTPVCNLHRIYTHTRSNTHTHTHTQTHRPKGFPIWISDMCQEREPGQLRYELHAATTHCATLQQMFEFRGQRVYTYKWTGDKD